MTAVIQGKSGRSPNPITSCRALQIAQLRRLHGLSEPAARAIAALHSGGVQAMTQMTDPKQLTRDLGGKWMRGYGLTEAVAGTVASPILGSAQ